jgi:hypothetical protein
VAARRTIILALLACPNFRDPEIAVAKNTHTPRQAAHPTVYPQAYELLTELPGKGLSKLLEIAL